MDEIKHILLVDDEGQILHAFENPSYLHDDYGRFTGECAAHHLRSRNIIETIRSESGR